MKVSKVKRASRASALVSPVRSALAAFKPPGAPMVSFTVSTVGVCTPLSASASMTMAISRIFAVRRRPQSTQTRAEIILHPGAAESIGAHHAHAPLRTFNHMKPGDFASINRRAILLAKARTHIAPNCDYTICSGHGFTIMPGRSCELQIPHLNPNPSQLAAVWFRSQASHHAAAVHTPQSSNCS